MFMFCLKKFILKLNNIKKYRYLLLFNLIHALKMINKENIIYLLKINNNNIIYILLPNNYFSIINKKEKKISPNLQHL